MKNHDRDLNCKANNYAFKIAIIYAAVSILWIIASDYALNFISTSTKLYSILSMLKGAFFVTITASLLYILIRNKLYTLYVSENRLQNALDNLQKTNDELAQTKEKLIVQYKKLVKNQEKVRELAYFDTLTGLPNRNHFLLMLEKFIKEAAFKGQQLALIYIDIDNFGKINNTLGHETGDIVLREIANRLKQTIGENGFVARITGDEFAIILYNFIDLNILNYFIYKIFDSFSRPWDVMDYDFYITPSMGISIYPSDGSDAMTLLKNADKALLSAKEKGKNTYCFYSLQMDEILQKRFEFEQSLKKAVENEEFVLYYQPIINLNNMKIAGAEALIRWIHPEKGFIPPLEFIPIAEQTGLISQIGKWVVKRALFDLGHFMQTLNGNFYVSVNVSLREFSSASFVESILSSIDNFKVEPSSLGIEITESVAMVDPQNTIDILNSLKKNRIKILLDDFGTGYSSLNYLKQLPIDVVKIDRSFIQNMTDDQKEQKIAKSLIDLSHILELKVVAEGIENEKQAELLKSFMCDFGQGYLFGKPMPKEEFLELAKKF
ncbi:putative bifunctional diguanylate cyclase/phosphodiesterase [Caldicellulosiruptor morganii]|uniref:EAL domain-containing protein n=1 Tax=Caldicellulosiruptor morganii TaxID=1387555 RepID=A0ABY7BMG4_9FIRM|nr:EAL domain-containing protein [Caldicellulosiruptor morganii]WAM34032.1 EAL domain-containing protein [Caldicellulosiruptor morganii]